MHTVPELEALPMVKTKVAATVPESDRYLRMPLPGKLHTAVTSDNQSSMLQLGKVTPHGRHADV